MLAAWGTVPVGTFGESAVQRAGSVVGHPPSCGCRAAEPRGVLPGVWGWGGPVVALDGQVGETREVSTSCDECGAPAAGTGPSSWCSTRSALALLSRGL